MGTTPQTDDRVIESQQAFEGKLISLRVDRLRLSTGVEITREVVLHPAAVAILPILPDDRMLLVRQYRHPVGDLLWEIPAGLVDPGESPLVAAKRELREETGYEAQDWVESISFFTSPGFTDEKIALYIARGLIKVGAPDLREIDTARGFASPELTSLIEDGTIRDAKTILAILAWQIPTHHSSLRQYGVSLAV
ncbi:MAG: NUDIX domain-containing protein [Nitrospirae bacterium]|nr:NUDIX domain-containing protein [Nitrospirota bacterium]